MTEEMTPAVLAIGIPCTSCKIPDVWYQHKEEGIYSRFSMKCHTCQHEWSSSRNHREENKKKCSTEQKLNT